MKPPEPDTHCFDEDTQSDVWSYSKELVEQMLAQADRDFSDGMTVVHLQVADQMRRKYEPVLRDVLAAIAHLQYSEPTVDDAIDAIRKVLK